MLSFTQNGAAVNCDAAFGIRRYLVEERGHHARREMGAPVIGPA